MWGLFRRNNIYPGPYVDLHLERLQNKGRTVLFGIFLHNTNVHVGECDLRLDMNEEMYYAGNIGETGMHIMPAGYCWTWRKENTACMRSTSPAHRRIFLPKRPLKNWGLDSLHIVMFLPTIGFTKGERKTKIFISLYYE